MVDVHIEPAYRQDGLAAQLQRAVEAALQHEGLPAAQDLSLVLTGDEKLHELNQQFMGEDHATDVLSFPSGELGNEDDAYLGDVLISVPRAATQAQAAGHSLAEELQLLAIHGVLHLLGHDHAAEDEKARMWAAQEAILASLGISPSIVPDPATLEH